MQKLSDSLNQKISQLEYLKILEDPIISDDKREVYNNANDQFYPLFEDIQAAASKLWVLFEKKLNKTDEEDD